MSKIATCTEGVLDVLLRVIRRSNLIASDGNIDAIRAVNPTLSEAARDALVAGFNYGIFGSVSMLSSPTDCTILVDNDNFNATTPYANVLRVAKGQTNLPIVDPYRELLTVGSASIVGYPVVLTLGPQQSLATGAEDCPAMLNLGVGGLTSATPGTYGMLTGTSTGLSLMARGVSLSALTLPLSLSYTAAGVVTNGIFLREATYPTTECLGFFQPAADKFYFRSTKTAACVPTIFFSGSYPNTTVDARMKVAIGGVLGTSYYDPTDLVIGGAYGGVGGAISAHEGTLLVVAHDVGDGTKHCALQVFSVTDNPPVNTHLVNFHSNIDHKITSNHVRLFSITGFWELNQDIAFEVRAGNASKLEPGTVVSQQGTTIVASNQVADKKAVGVISTKPGMILGDAVSTYTEDQVAPVATSGSVPVKVTTLTGSIEVGDRLVSAPAGRACKGDQPGCVIGKALEALEAPETGEAFGVIKMLVMVC